MASKGDVLVARQVKTTQAQSIDLGVQRAQLEPYHHRAYQNSRLSILDPGDASADRRIFYRRARASNAVPISLRRKDAAAAMPRLGLPKPHFIPPLH